LFSEILEVRPYDICEAVRHRVAVDRNQSVVRLEPGQSLAHARPQFGQRLHDLALDQIPLRLLAVTFELGSHGSSAIPDAGCFVAKIPLGEHILDVSQPVRPGEEILSSEGTSLALIVPGTGFRLHAAPGGRIILFACVSTGTTIARILRLSTLSRRAALLRLPAVLRVAGILPAIRGWDALATRSVSGASLLLTIGIAHRVVPCARLSASLRPPTGRTSRLIRIRGRGASLAGASDLVVHFANQLVELLLGESKRFLFIAEHVGRCVLDALAKSFDALAGQSLDFLCLRQEVPPEQFARGLKGSVEVLRARLAKRIVKLP
jgi:hypothetical protein